MNKRTASGGVWEGIGGPVHIQTPNLGGIDPALDDCCRREVESNRRRTVLEATLSRHDVTLMAERRRRHLIPRFSWGEGCRCCYDPNSDGGEYKALIEARQRKDEEEGDIVGEDDDETEEDNNESDEDEFDYLLDEYDFCQEIGGGRPPSSMESGLAELEDRRRAELEFAILRQQTALQHGFGAHRQLHPGRVLKACGLGSHLAGNRAFRQPPPAVVLHLFDPESPVSGSLDLCLEELAEIYRGTKFMRSGGRPTLLMDVDNLATKSFPRLSPSDDLPALVAVREGVVISHVPRLQGLHEDEQVIRGSVRDWLDRAGILIEQVPDFEEICHVWPEEEALLDNMIREKAKLDAIERYDCGIPSCCKPYAHDHIGIRNSKQDGLVVQEETVLGEAEV